jgi:hypothetical protein
MCSSASGRPDRSACPHPVAEVIRTGGPSPSTSSPTSRSTTSRPTRTSATCSEACARSCIVLPLGARGSVLGALTLSDHAPLEGLRPDRRAPPSDWRTGPRSPSTTPACTSSSPHRIRPPAQPAAAIPSRIRGSRPPRASSPPEGIRGRWRFLRRLQEWLRDLDGRDRRRMRKGPGGGVIDRPRAVHGSDRLLPGQPAERHPPHPARVDPAPRGPICASAPPRSRASRRRRMGGVPPI